MSVEPDASKKSSLLSDEKDEMLGILKDLLKAVKRLPKALNPSDQAQLSRGRTALVAPNNNLELFVNTETLEEEKDWVVSIQAASLPVDHTGAVYGGANPSTICGVLKYTIVYFQGEAEFQIQGEIDSLEIIQVQVSARKVVLAAGWIPTGPAGSNASNSVISLTGGAAVTGIHPANTQPNPALWYRTPSGLYTQGATNAVVVSNANTEAKVPSNGQVDALYGSLVSGPSSPTVSWVMLLDLAGATGPTAGGLPLWVSDPLLVGQGFSYRDDETVTAWNYKLWCGLSSTPDVFTPVAGTFSLNVKGG